VYSGGGNKAMFWQQYIEAQVHAYAKISRTTLTARAQEWEILDLEGFCQYRL